MKKNSIVKKNMPLRHRMKDLLMMTASIIIYSVAISFFFGASTLAPGGVSGLAIAHERRGFLPFGKGLIILIINIPILILGVLKFGFRFSASTLVSVFTSSLLIEALDKIKVAVGYSIAPLPAAIGGGVLVAVGLIMRAGSTYGGTDIIVKVLRLKYKYMQTGTFYLIVDGIIILFGSICTVFENGQIVWQNFNPEILIYSALGIFIQSYFSNMILYGTDGARMIYIITTKEEEISERINHELHAGVTYLQGQGAYTGNKKHILLCAMHKQVAPNARQIVLEEDPDAFMIVTSASQVLGKGFKRLDEEDL